MAGCVYVMAIPQWQKVIGRRRIRIQRTLVKIGHVEAPENLESRKRNLESQYDGTEFRVECVIEIPGYDRELDKANYLVVENRLHQKFETQRVRIRNRQGGEAREFFDLNIRTAVTALKETSTGLRGKREIKSRSATKDVLKNQSQGGKSRSKTGVRNRSDIPVDAVLTFIENPRIKCTVTRKEQYKRGRREKSLQVEYGRWDDWSLSDLTKYIKKGSPRSQYNGWLYWEYNGVLLSDLKIA